MFARVHDRWEVGCSDFYLALSDSNFNATRCTGNSEWSSHAYLMSPTTIGSLVDVKLCGLGRQGEMAAMLGAKHEKTMIFNGRNFVI